MRVLGEFIYHLRCFAHTTSFLSRELQPVQQALSLQLTADNCPTVVGLGPASLFQEHLGRLTNAASCHLNCPPITHGGLATMGRLSPWRDHANTFVCVAWFWMRYFTTALVMGWLLRPS